MKIKDLKPGNILKARVGANKPFILLELPVFPNFEPNHLLFYARVLRDKKIIEYYIGFKDDPIDRYFEVLA